MAKKNKEKSSDVEAPNPNNVSNRDIVQRLNFLYQASVYINGIEANAECHNQGRRGVTTSDLSRSYVKTMKTVGQKTTVKMDPSVKRTLCRGCNIILIPGLTASVRVKSSPSHGHAVTYTCNACNTSRRIPAPPTLAPPSTSSLPSPSNPLISASSAPISTANIIPPTTGSTPKETLDTRAQAQHQHQQRKKKKKPPVPRLPPLFAREGHVVFSGNERLEAEQPAMDWDG